MNKNECKGNEMTEIILNGEIYVKKVSDNDMKYMIIRSHSAGVFAGYVESIEGSVVTIRKARRLWYWDGAASLSQLAVDGVARPQNCKFPCEVDRIVVLEAIELLDVTEKAKNSIASVDVWAE